MGIEVTKDEGDQQQFDATQVSGLDPNFVYRWVRKDPVNVTRQQMKGYETVVKTPEMVHILNDRTKMKKGEDVSTAVEWGDMILMRTTKENHEERLGRKRAKIHRQTKGVTQAYKDAVARMSRANGQADLSFEEHRENKRQYGEGMTASELDESLGNQPWNEDKRIGRK